MHVYGPTFLTAKIATKEDLSSLIVCKDQLPDVSTVVDGTVMQLTKSQVGYVATHFYRATDDVWKDITAECGPLDRVCKTSELKAAYELYINGHISYYTGYLKLWWTHAPSSITESGNLIGEVVVRKQCNKDGSIAYPQTPYDGEVIVRCGGFSDGEYETTYTSDKPYKYYDEALTGDANITYCYRLFHVYKTGWYSYTDGPIISAKI